MSRFQEEVERGAEAAAQHEQASRRAYSSAFRELGLDAADRFEQHARVLVAGAAGDWSQPDADQVYPLAAGAKKLHDKTDSKRRTMVAVQSEPVSAAYGFDQADPLLEGVIASLGQKITNVAASQRTDIMGVIQRGYDEGLSIRATADMLRANVRGTSPSRAIACARTELCGATNGAQVAMGHLIGNTEKEWLAGGGANSRPEHDAASGQRVPLGQPFAVGGDRLMYPGDPDGDPSMTVNCRCTILQYGADDSTLAASAGRMISLYGVRQNLRFRFRTDARPV